MKIKEPVFIGYGFTWEPEDSQYAREIYARKSQALHPPKWYAKLRELAGLASTRNIHGVPWLHGLGSDREREVFIDADDLYSHVGIIGSTGSGKGRLMEPFLLQALQREGEAVIIIDPKLDEGLRNRAYGELKRQGRPEDFKYFAPAHPDQSVRINPMQNYSAGSQVASRTTSTLPASGRGDNFQSFVWKSINNVIQGMILAGDPPSLKAIRYLVEGNVEDLFVRAFERYIKTIEGRFPNWREDSREHARTNSDKKKGGSDLWQIYLSYYDDVTSRVKTSEPLEGLRSILNHPGDHYSKMIVTIAPQLTALTTEAIGAMLSPDYDDDEDPRPIVNTKQVIERGQVLYLALNSLADHVSAGWIGSLILSDLVAVAADRYNYQGGGRWGVTVIVDELSQVANEQFVQALSMSRGANFRVLFSTQTAADLAVRFGSKDNANQILGNVNTMFFLRSKDYETKEYASAKMGTTRITSIKQGHVASTKTDSLEDFSRSLRTDFSEQDGEPRVPVELFDELPDLHYFATLHDGRRMKLRMPFTQTEPEFRYPETPHGDLPLS